MIIYFSGTGNSRMTALMLRHPDETIVELSDNPPMSLDIRRDERVVWIFPVYAWGLPSVIKRYMKRVEFIPADASDAPNSADTPDCTPSTIPTRPTLPDSSSDLPVSSPHFMVCTCGDDVGLTHLEWRKEIRRRGWRPVGTFSVEMPNTYVLLPGFDVDDPLKEEEKLSKAPARIRAIARAIRHRARVDDVVRGRFPWIKSRILRPLFNLFLMSPRPFRHTDACVGCGLCASHCPMRNITMTRVDLPKNGRREDEKPQLRIEETTLRGRESPSRPKWGRDCAMCLECYHVCPRHAVAYGNATSKKGQYSGPGGVKKI